jgi:hypothetical protein
MCGNHGWHKRTGDIRQRRAIHPPAARHSSGGGRRELLASSCREDATEHWF